MTIRLNGSTSGYTQLDSPAVGGNNTLFLPAGNGTANQILRNGATAGSLEFTDKIVSGTAVASTSGTAIDFTGIPSWVKRVTVMFSGVSTNGTSNYRIQLGAGSNQTTGYNSNCLTASTSAAASTTNATAGFDIGSISTAGATLYGSAIFSLLGSNSWVCQGQFSNIGDSRSHYPAGAVALSGTLDRIRITTVNGTDTFDAGSINILYE